MKKKNGFTLIELLVVFSIIGILAAAGIASYVQAGKSARDAKRKSDIETVRQALILYRSEEGEYDQRQEPANNARYGYMVNALSSAGYLSSPPPSDSRYTYTSFNTTTRFCLCTSLEISNGNSTAVDCSEMDSVDGAYYCVTEP